MYNVHGPSIGSLSLGSPPMKLMDVIESDELGDLDVEFVNNEVSKMPCRDFGMGFCEHGASCKFYHRYRLGVYTFCNKFQYSSCTVPQCKYIHASPYEQQTYYRTGKFVSYGLQHLNKPTTTPCRALMPGSSVDRRLTRSPIPKPLLPESPEPPEPMVDISDIPLPDAQPAQSPPHPEPSEAWMSSTGRAPKRSWLAMDDATNSSGDPIKRCASCDVQME